MHDVFSHSMSLTLFANYPVLDLNCEVTVLELSFFILQTMKLSFGQYRFDVVPVDKEGGS